MLTFSKYLTNFMIINIFIIFPKLKYLQLKYFMID